MALTVSNLLVVSLQNGKRGLLQPIASVTAPSRNASKKAAGSTKNPKGHPRPKHRGWRVQDGWSVQSGTILATQLKLRFHPGLNAGFGKDGTLFAMEPGKVIITCEKIDPNWDHTWVAKNYEGRYDQTIYKKHFNIIPEPQHNNFKITDTI